MAPASRETSRENQNLISWLEIGGKK